MLQTFATKAVSRLERSQQWRALTQAEQVVFEDDRQASLRGDDFGPLRLCIVSLGRHRIVQSRESTQTGLVPTLKLLFQEEGRAIVRQSGQATQLHPGQWCAVRKDIAFSLESPDHSRQLALTLPCALLPELRRSIDWWRQPRAFLRGPGFILHASASAMLMAGGTFSPADRDRLAAQLLSLADMTIRADAPDCAPDLREVRRRAILDFIDRHLADPGLGVAAIARAFNFSSRTVHKLFEGEAQTVARAIWDRRLERCRDDMADPSMAARSITEIAHLWGFSDSQHFSRAFKLRYGLTPRDYRNRFALH